MLLYHGTSERVARLALKQGLWPRAKLDEEEGNWEVESNPDHVYLTRAYAPYFAAQKSKEGERWGIVQVDVKDVDMRPDEDFLEQATRTMSPKDIIDMSVRPQKRLATELAACKGDMKKRTAWFRDHLTDFRALWAASIQKMGNACFNGNIPRWSIKRIALFDPDTNLYVTGTCLDPTITIINYRFCGAKYRMLTDWFFSGECNSSYMARVIVNGAGFGDAEDIPAAMRDAVEKQYSYAAQQLAKRNGVEVIENENFNRS